MKAVQKMLQRFNFSVDKGGTGFYSVAQDASMEYSVDKIEKSGEFTPENSAHDKERQTGKRGEKNDLDDIVTISPEARQRSASVPPEEAPERTFSGKDE